jgi:UDP-N-acetylglucosamine--N-acetylmuramyl-(pentapeptide) pyrophosphoryl-undecaprenol N-acetylglucosamine transferase
MMKHGKTLNIMIAGGGTGGHLFPGVAIAEEFIKRDHETAILFIGTERGLEQRILKDLGYVLRTIDVEGIRGKGLIKSAGGILKIPASMIQCYPILRDFNPDLVIGVGGYASGPAVIMAYCMGKKTAIAEQNAMPGLTNRILGRFVDRVFITFAVTEKWFSKKKTVVTGNPVRAGFVQEEKKQREESKSFTLLIYGGSQGAAGINSAVIESLPYLEKMRDGLKIMHQTGERDVTRVSKAYEDYHMDAHVCSFINNMAGAYDAADLLICRAGATTIAEITARGKAALFIPFPYAVGDHQRLNAQVLVDAGAAQMILERDITGEKLARVVEELCHDRDHIKRMEEKSQALGYTRAAAHIVDECMKLIHGEKILN